MKAIRIHQHGGPEVLRYEETQIREIGVGEVLVRNRAIGVNFTDIYSRNGAFPPPSLPFVPGKEGAGEVIAVGERVTDFASGDRVAYVETLGAYAEQCIVSEHFLVHLPPSISYEVAASFLLRGLTAHFLVHRTFQVKRGDIVLVQAAAGGVGGILTQWAKHLGATVIGTAGSSEKLKIARQHGCDHVINYHDEDVAQRVKEITSGEGCHVVYDSVGKMTFPSSLDCLRPFGHFVSFGFASGTIPPFDIMLLLEKGSLYATWPGLTMYLSRREDVLSMSKELFDAIDSGLLSISPPTALPLAQAAEAHRRIGSRQAPGAMVLVP